MQLDLLWAFVLIYFVDSIAPGPSVAMVISRGASVGLLRTLPFIAGLVLGDVMLFIMALLGLMALVKTLGPLFFILKWVGVAYLLYLAFTMWKAKPTELDVAPSGGTGWRSFLLAIILPLGNPKAVGFYVALLPAFMDVAQLTLMTAVNFCVAIIVIWTLVLAGYAAMADLGRRHLKDSAAQKWLNRASAGAMAAAAGTVALRT